MGCDSLVHVGGVDIIELDKYPVGNSQKHLKIFWDDSPDLKLPRQCVPKNIGPLGPITKIYYMNMKGDLKVPFMPSLSQSKTGGANRQSSCPWVLELAFCCTFSCVI